MNSKFFHIKSHLNTIFVLLLYHLIVCHGRETFLERFFHDTNSYLTNSPIRDTTWYMKEYDFIVVGAGSGGSVMANRLTEEGDWTVLLLELGKEETIVTDVPISSAVAGVTGTIV